MSPRAPQIAAGTLLLAGGAALMAFGYVLGGLAAIALGLVTTLAKKA